MYDGMQPQHDPRFAVPGAPQLGPPRNSMNQYPPFGQGQQLPVTDMNQGASINQPGMGLQGAAKSGLETLPNPSALCSMLDTKLNDRKMRRRIIEDEWLDCFRRYDGQYDAMTMSRLVASRRSRIWLGFTAMKVHSALSAILDYLIGTDDNPWDIDPEPFPQGFVLPPELIEQGITPEVLKAELKHRTEKLKVEMQNQLDDADFPTHLSDTCFEQCLLGTGAIKGPITVKDDHDDYQMILDSNNSKLYPQEVRVEGYKPSVKSISVFTCYPDMECSNVQKGDGFFEEEFLTRGEMVELATEPGVDPLAVLAILTERPNGNADLNPALIQLRLMSGDTDAMAVNRYGVYRYYGPVTGKNLFDAGVNVPQEMHALHVNAYVMYCAGRILTAKVHKGPIPYYLIPYVPRPGKSPFGKGIAMLAKDTQDAINAAARMMIDNAAISSGPIIEANTALLMPGEDPTDIYGWRVFLSKYDNLGGAQKQAIRVFDIQNYAPLFIQLINLFRQFMDEATFIPSVTEGQSGPQITKTATGMSILNSNSNRAMKTIMRSVDNKGIKPLIKAMVHWNLRFNPDMSILARVNVRAKGVAQVMAKEMQSDRIMAMYGAFGQQPWFKSVDAAREVVSSLDIPEDKLIMSDEEMSGAVQPDFQGGAGATEPAQGIPGPGGAAQPPRPGNPPRVLTNQQARASKRGGIAPQQRRAA